VIAKLCIRAYMREHKAHCDLWPWDQWHDVLSCMF